MKRKKMAIEVKKNNFNIELLNSNNYHTWKFRLNILFEEKDVLECIKNEFNENNYNTETEKKAARIKDNKCKSYIVQCLEDNQIDLVRDKSTAYSMWKSLEERYEKRGIPGQMILRKRLMNMKLQKESDLEMFLLEFEEIIRQLKVTGAELKEEDLICTLLLAMPPSFETVITILENMKNDELTLEVAKNKLRGEIERRKATDNDNKKTENIKPAVFEAVKETNREGSCYICGKKGHFQRDCRNRGRGTFMNRNFRGQNNRRPQWNVRGRFNYRGRGYGASTSRDETVQGHLVEQNEDRNVCFMSDVRKEVNQVDVSSIVFCIDSGCTDHLINGKEYFSDFMYLNNPIKIHIAKNNSFMEATGVGNLKVKSYVFGKSYEILIKNVLFVPNLRRNLLSIKRLELSNIKVIFENGKVLLYKENNLLGIGKRDKLYEISFELNRSECLNIEVHNENLKLWHNRLGHICNSNLNKLISKNMINGLENCKTSKIDFCESCIQGKMSKLNFGTRTKAKRILGIVHTDIAGPISPTSHSDERYFITFIDDFSSFVYVFIIKNKSDAFDCFKEYVNIVQTKFNSKIEILRCDNGREYISKEMKEFCKNNGTVIDFTNPYTPQQNGKAERYNRSLIEKSRSMIHEGKVPKEFWNEAVRVAAYAINRSPHHSLETKTPAEVWYGEKPNVRNMKIFGCTAYAHIPHQFRGKFEKKTKKCIMMGYTNTGYRLWDTENNKIITSRDVKFNESSFYFKENRIDIDISDDDIVEEAKEYVEPAIDESIEDQQSEEGLENSKKEKRKIKVPERYNDYQLYMAFDAVSYIENAPECVEELNNRDDKNMWLRAMSNEIKSIEENKTWEETRKPENIEILSTKWVFAVKPHEDKIQDRYKARIVVRGFAQKESFDYNEIYSPVARMSTIRTLLSIGTLNMHYFKQLDVKTAFLNGELKEKIYVYPPENVECRNGHVLKLNKSLYGLKQASKCWNQKINEFLISLEFKRSETDYCLYVKGNNKDVIYLLIYVDDIILSGPNLKLLDECKDALMKGFKIKDKGDLRNFLGLEIMYEREKGILEINQEKYIEGILKRFNFENCKICTTPIDPKLKIDITNNDKNEIRPVKQLIGCLMYLMLGTRPDLSFAINYYSRFQDINSEKVWIGLKRVLRYIKGTQKLSLIYKRNIDEMGIKCYVDSDWAGDINDRKSVTGYIIKVFGNSIVWVTRKQQCIALSSSEAELIALCAAVCECLFIQKLLKDMGIEIENFKVYEDNQGCISLIRQPENNRRVKHIDIKFKFVCELFSSKVIIIEYINSTDQLADILTKGQHKNQLYSNRYEIGLQ